MGVYEKARNETKNRIKHEFWVLYKENRMNKITVGQIAEAAGIHRATFYIHYKDVYEIIEEIEADLMTDIESLDVTDTDTEIGLIRMGKILFDEYREKQEYLHVLVKEQRDSMFANAYRDVMIHKMLHAFQRDSQNRTEIQTKVVEITVSQVADIFVRCADDEAIYFEDMVKLMMGFMSKGFYHTMAEDFKVGDLINPLEKLN